LGGIQPDRLTPYLAAAIYGGDNDGLMQRFSVLVYPDSDERDPIDRAPDEKAAPQVLTIIEHLSKIGRLDIGDVPFLHFTDAAQALFDEWLINLTRSKLRNTDDHSIIREHLSKFRKVMPALALIFHAVESADTGRQLDDFGGVCADCTKLAIAWCDYLEAHARRIYGLVLGTSRAAFNLAGKIKKGSLADGFTVHDIKQKDWSMLTTTEKAESACEVLEEKGWLRRYEVSAGESGGRPTVRFRINPKIKRKTGEQR
jgi:Protein of unknown function (DUF3987)